MWRYGYKELHNCIGLGNTKVKVSHPTTVQKISRKHSDRPSLNIKQTVLSEAMRFNDGSTLKYIPIPKHDKGVLN